MIKKQCIDCKQEKPLSNFYTMSGRPHIHDSYCKKCKRSRSRNAKQHDKSTPANSFERLAIQKLRQQGIICNAGKMYGRNYVDITCWGGVDIEVKHSTFRQRKYVFKPTPKQIEHGFRAHLVMLICTQPDATITMHIFDKNTPAFYKNGSLKTGIVYMPDKERKYEIANSKSTIMDADMIEAFERWGLIEVKRLELSDALKYTK